MSLKRRFETWTYASASSVTVAGDYRNTYWPGMRVALKQTTLKYFVIESVTYSAPNTVIALNGMGIYTVADAPITAHIDTLEVYPKGFPVQVATLACGLAGGQTIYGGTGPDEVLTLRGTVDESKGRVKVDGDFECTGSLMGLTSIEPPNFDPGQFGNDFSECFSDHGCFIGWNRAAGDGETDLVNVKAGGSGGGFSLYEYNAVSENIDLLLKLNGLGGLYLPNWFRVKVGANADSTGQPSGDFAAIIYHANNLAGKNGLLVKNNWQAAGSTVFEAGCDFLGGVYYSFFKVLGDGSVCLDWNKIQLNWRANEGSWIQLGGNNGVNCHLENLNGVFRVIDHNWQNENLTVSQAGDVVIRNNCSALSFTDRTEAFEGDALEAIRDISADENGNIDHDTLPGFARAIRVVEGEEMVERDLGNMISILTEAVKQLDQNYRTAIAERDDIIAALTKRIEGLEAR